jgi:hypothetical protein
VWQANFTINQQVNSISKVFEENLVINSNQTTVKNSNFILTLFIIIASILYGCNTRSKKGQWSESDKKRFYKEMGRVDLTGQAGCLDPVCQF